MQDQVSKIVSFHERSATSVESMVARKEENKGMSIKEVLSIVKECGAAPGTKEFFIASELFTKRTEREMFMTLDTPQECFEWRTMKHFVKYSHYKASCMLYPLFMLCELIIFSCMHESGL
jgi:hypothetical protein